MATVNCRQSCDFGGGLVALNMHVERLLLGKVVGMMAKVNGWSEWSRSG